MKMGYLLHSGDPKILWLRTARFARRPGKTHPPFALEASGALPTGGGDFCGTWRRAVPIQADTVGHAHSNGLASPGHRQPLRVVVVAAGLSLIHISEPTR